MLVRVREAVAVAVVRLVRHRDAWLRPAEVRLVTRAACVGRVVEELLTAQEHREIGNEVATAVEPRIYDDALSRGILAHHFLEGRAIGAVVHPRNVHVAELTIARLVHFVLVLLHPARIEKAVLLAQSARHIATHALLRAVGEAEQYVLARLPIQELGDVFVGWNWPSV